LGFAALTPTYGSTVLEDLAWGATHQPCHALVRLVLNEASEIGDRNIRRT
jgi:hypothetical protein